MPKFINDLMAYEKARHEGRKGKKIMRRFSITEISAVDAPAQQGAAAVLMKRREPDPTTIERAFAALLRRTERLAEKVHRDTKESLRLAEQGEAMMDEEDDPDLAELEAKRERGRERYLSRPSVQARMANRSTAMTTKQHFKNLAREGRQAQLADNFRKRLNECETRQDMQKAIDDDPEGYHAFQQWGDDIERGPDPEGDAVEKTVSKRLELDRKVAKAVDDVRERDGCSGTEAMQKARDENPDLFDEWQSHHSAL